MNMQRALKFTVMLSLFFSFSLSVSAMETDAEYKDKIGTKALSGLANIGAGVLEIPKNAINLTNDSNIIWGMTIGTLKGAVFAIGRIGSGFADLVTFPFATTPITYPVYVWDDFDSETRFGDGMRLEDRPRRDAFMP
jgi:putative exosortase-associated protein (TIGR04073 family)